jgi:hypothetical protein
VMLDEAYPLLRVSPLQCLIILIMTSSPFPDLALRMRIS